MSMYPMQHEKAGVAEFILSEAPGHRSRENALFRDPVVLEVGMPIKQVTPRTETELAVYQIATGAADMEALAIYGGASVSGTDLAVSIIARDAEVNGLCIRWPDGFTAANILSATVKLAEKGIIVRDKG